MSLSALFAAIFLFQTPPASPPRDAADPDGAESFGFRQDSTERMTVPVIINGAGPYNFIVDTGAERTVISRELARKLRLDEGNAARVHSVTEVQTVGTFIIPDLSVNKNKVQDIHAPALAQRNLGADGMLGVDSLQSQRVLFDFERNTMWVSHSATKPEVRMEGDTIIVRARSRFGRLILANAHVDEERVAVIVDTGSQVTIGNLALRRKLAAKGKLNWMGPVEVISVTGGRLKAPYAQINVFKIGGLELQNMPVAFADAHPFEQLDLKNRPALLLGMDTLALFDRVSIDFAKRTVRFDMPDLTGRLIPTRMAAAEPAGRSVGQ